MEFMNIEEIQNLVTIVGGIGSLVYLAFQVKQHTEAAWFSAFHQFSGAMDSLLTAIAQDEQLAEIFQNGISNGKELKETDRARFQAIMMSLFYNYEQIFSLREKNSIASESWANSFQNAAWIFRQSGVREFSKTRVGPLGKEFNTYLEKCFVSPMEAHLSKNDR
jgi:hypothetical protein